MDKLLRKPVLVKKSLFHLFWNWFLLFLSFLHRKLVITEELAKLSKRDLPANVLIILQLSRSVRLRRK